MWLLTKVIHAWLIYVKWAESAPIYVAKGFILVRRFYAYIYNTVRDMLIKLYHSTKCVTEWKTTEVEYSTQQFINLMPAPLPPPYLNIYMAEFIEYLPVFGLRTIK